MVLAEAPLLYVVHIFILTTGWRREEQSVASTLMTPQSWHDFCPQSCEVIAATHSLSWLGLDGNAVILV